MTQETVAYILARTDLPSMNYGKTMAQIHHAGVQMLSKHPNSTWVKSYISEGSAGGADGFSTTIVLGATLSEIETAIARLKSVSCLYGIIVDPTYPFVVESEISSYMRDNPKVSFVKSLEDGRDLFTRAELT